MERDKKTLAELEEARRLFEEVGLNDEAHEVTEVRDKLAGDSPSREFATLYEIGQAINSIIELEPLLDRITDLAADTLEADRCLVILIDERTGEHHVPTAREVERETTADAIRYSESVVAAAARGRPILSSDALSDQRYCDFKSVSLYAIKSFMCVPLRLRERSIGTVYVDSRRIGNLFDRDDLLFLEAFANQAALAIENARLMRRLKDENRMLRETVSRQYGFDRIIGRSAKMERLLQMLSKLAAGTAPILLTGESGTGKELFAKSIHQASPRSDGPFVALNCAAIPSELLESELFGHVRGSFSGAERDKKGLLEAAEGGTFFFDEVAELAPALQAKLLRAVEEGAIRRVGETRMRSIDIRVLSATNRNLKEEIAAGRFREDLYYRLNVVAVHVPPLRERPEDILPLATHFLRRLGERDGVAYDGFTSEALDAMTRHDWPGNVRELENAIERAVALAESTRIARADLPDDVADAVRGAGERLAEAGSPTERASALWGAIVDDGRSFWEVVRGPFLRRELSREDVRRLVERGLAESGGSYKRLAELFGVGEQYKKFHAFLKNNGCHVDRSQVARGDG